MASPDAACPGLPQKPLDAAIGQLPARALANATTTTKNGPTLLAIMMAVAVRRYKTAHIA
jgi:hypothetical protein